MIVIRDTALPDGLSPREAAALVYGAERAASDLIVLIRTRYTPEEIAAAAALNRAATAAEASYSTAPGDARLRQLQTEAEELGGRVAVMTDGSYRLVGVEKMLGDGPVLPSAPHDLRSVAETLRTARRIQKAKAT